jgi:hypothetical protein
MALQFEARKVALKQDRTGYVLTLSLHPDEIPVELLRDLHPDEIPSPDPSLTVTRRRRWLLTRWYWNSRQE